MNYYNDNDAKACAWLEALISAGLIPPGDVDNRSIADVKPEELKGYTQCHFFAGIGGWSLALQLAGVGPDVPVWTGSCPCQPFSSAGKGKGTEDERHLWPEFARLIGECKPPTVFGEQVASKAGRAWFDGVSTDLENMGYAAAAADLCAAGVNAPHIRQRLFWVANAVSERRCKRIARCKDAANAAGSGEDVWSGYYRGCADGYSRRVPPGVPLLANGVPGRVELMQGFGNAIVPQVAAEFIQAYMEIKSEGANQ